MEVSFTESVKFWYILIKILKNQEKMTVYYRSKCTFVETNEGPCKTLSDLEGHEKIAILED